MRTGHRALEVCLSERIGSGLLPGRQRRHTEVLVKLCSPELPDLGCGVRRKEAGPGWERDAIEW